MVLTGTQYYLLAAKRSADNSEYVLIVIIVIVIENSWRKEVLADETSNEINSFSGKKQKTKKKNIN